MYSNSERNADGNRCNCFQYANTAQKQTCTADFMHCQVSKVVDIPFWIFPGHYTNILFNTCPLFILNMGRSLPTTESNKSN